MEAPDFDHIIVNASFFSLSGHSIALNSRLDYYSVLSTTQLKPVVFELKCSRYAIEHFKSWQK